MQLVAETHQIVATNDFDGALPASEVHYRNGERLFKPDDGGGLFTLPLNVDDATKLIQDPEELGQVRVLRSFRVVFGGQSSWTLHITGGPSDVLWLSGTVDTSLVVTDTLDLLPHEKLKLTTTGASTAMLATALYSLRKRVA
jgi:hypothetical protein